MLPHMNTIVSTTDLHRRYGEGPAAVEALAGVSVDIAAGAFTAIMGASGSGKSTLTRLPTPSHPRSSVAPGYAAPTAAAMSR